MLFVVPALPASQRIKWFRIISPSPEVVYLFLFKATSELSHNTQSQIAICRVF